MHRRHLDDWRPRVALIGIIALALPVSELKAQGITTAAIEGTVRATDRSDVDGARVTVVNSATGFAVDTHVRHGRFLVQGLEVGGPYTIQIDRLGIDTLRVVAAPFVIGADGSGLTTLHGAPTPGQSSHSPSWSPDGSQIAYAGGQSSNRIWIVGFEGGAFGEPFPFRFGSAPSWR